MSRYSRVRGPTFDFELTGVVQTITGMRIARHFDDGELLIHYHATILNLTSPAVAVNFILQLLLDGATLTNRSAILKVANGDQATLGATALESIAAGFHTLQLQAQGHGNVGDVVRAFTAHLIAIQLPLWDDPANLTDL